MFTHHTVVIYYMHFKRTMFYVLWWISRHINFGGTCVRAAVLEFEPSVFTVVLVPVLKDSFVILKLNNMGFF